MARFKQAESVSTAVGTGSGPIKPWKAQEPVRAYIEPVKAANAEPARAANIDADQMLSSPGQIIRSSASQASNQHSKLLADPSREN
jgi:hypothetical protein